MRLCDFIGSQSNTGYRSQSDNVRENPGFISSEALIDISITEVDTTEVDTSANRPKSVFQNSDLNSAGTFKYVVKHAACFILVICLFCSSLHSFSDEKKC